MRFFGRPRAAQPTQPPPRRRRRRYRVAALGLLVLVLGSVKLHEAARPAPQPLAGRLAPVPKGFLWGVATAGHQWEGNDTTSNWTAWERSGHVREQSGRAADGLNRWSEDLDLAKGMGLNAFRMSIEWCRIEPQPGHFDQTAIAHYHQVLTGARQRGLEPIVTLFHNAYPAWLDAEAPPDMTIWETPRAVEAYARYVDFVSREYGRDIRYYLTINEPTVMVEGGYLAGCWPPGKHDPVAFLRASRTLIDAHARAYDVIHHNDPDALVSFNNYAAAYQVSMDYHQDAKEPAPGVDWFLAAFAKLAVPGRTDRPGRKLDFMAVDYYKRLTFPTQLVPPSPSQWHIYPPGFDEVLQRYYEAFKLPILVAENGMATDNGQPRSDGWTRDSYIVEHIAQVQGAIARGIPVIGYTYWTLMDNYEWGSFDDRFGLYRVECRKGDYRRVATPAVAVYKAIVAAGGVTPEMLARHGFTRVARMPAPAP